MPIPVATDGGLMPVLLRRIRPSRRARPATAVLPLAVGVLGTRFSRIRAKRADQAVVRCADTVLEAAAELLVVQYHIPDDVLKEYMPTPPD